MHLQRSRAEALSRRVASLESEVSESASLRRRVAALEHSLALVRQAAAGADGAGPLVSPNGATTAGEHAAALQSALSGFGGQPHMGSGEVGVHAAAPPRTAHEMVVDSRGGQGRKRGRPAVVHSRRPSPELHAQHARLPPPLSPLRAPERDELPPPLSPLLPRLATPGVSAPEDGRTVAAPKRLPPKQRKVDAAAPRASVALLMQPGIESRAGAVPLGKSRAKAAAAAPGEHLGSERDGALAAVDDIPAPVTPAEHAHVEASAASVASDAGVCAVLTDAAASGEQAVLAAARGLAAAVLTRTVSPTALLSGVLAFARSGVDGVLHGLPPAVLEMDAALVRARQSGRGGVVRLLGAGVPGGFADAVASALRGAVMDAALGRGAATAAAASSTACAAVGLMRARDQLPAARTLLLDVLQHGSGAGGASSPLAVTAFGALSAWPGLLSGYDPLAVAAAAVVRAALTGEHASADERALQALQLHPPLSTATPGDALELSLAWLHRCAGESVTPDELHSVVRALELLACHAGAAHRCTYTCTCSHFCRCVKRTYAARLCIRRLGVGA